MVQWEWQPGTVVSEVETGHHPSSVTLQLKIAAYVDDLFACAMCYMPHAIFLLMGWLCCFLFRVVLCFVVYVLC